MGTCSSCNTTHNRNKASLYLQVYYYYKAIKTKAGAALSKAFGPYSRMGMLATLKKNPKSYHGMKQKAIFIIFDLEIVAYSIILGIGVDTMVVIRFLTSLFFSLS